MTDEEVDTLLYDLDTQTMLAEQLVELIRTKEHDFPTALMRALRLLAECYEGADTPRYDDAAKVLGSFRWGDYREEVEATFQERVWWFVHMAENLLEIDRSGAASQAISKAMPLVKELVLEDKEQRLLHIQFKFAYARIQDIERKFLNASRDYRQLAVCYGDLGEPSLLKCLENAITCAILADASGGRDKALAMLYYDERSSTRPNYFMLEKMFRDRIIRKSELKKFDSLLQSHQQAINKDGITVLENAVKSHNIKAVSKIYSNITFTELGHILDLSPMAAEDMARTMIEKKQLQGTIDQVQEIIEFEADSGVLRQWDSSISHVCNMVNDTLDSINGKFPQYKY
jgi:COP9 signalosome complex subunit 4